MIWSFKKKDGNNRNASLGQANMCRIDLNRLTNLVRNERKEIMDLGPAVLQRRHGMTVTAEVGAPATSICTAASGPFSKVLLRVVTEAAQVECAGSVGQNTDN